MRRLLAYLAALLHSSRWRPHGPAPATRMRRYRNGAWEYRDMTPEELAEEEWWWSER